jgi:hypothetical protein
MTIPSYSRTAFVIGFWVYGAILLMATHAPAKDVQFLARAAENGLLDPDKLLHLTASFIQLSYRLYRIVSEAKREGADSAKDKFKQLRKESKRKLRDAAKSGGAKLGQQVEDGAEDGEGESSEGEGEGEGGRGSRGDDASATTMSSQPRRVESVRTDVNVTGDFEATTSAQVGAPSLPPSLPLPPF